MFQENLQLSLVVSEFFLAGKVAPVFYPHLARVESVY